MICMIAILACNSNESHNAISLNDSAHNCMEAGPRFSGEIIDENIKSSDDTSHSGMVYIPGGTFMMGGDNEQASRDEYPKHSVKVSPFWMDETEVTKAQFKAFVDATGYVTTAEQKPDWDELKKRFRLVHLHLRLKHWCLHHWFFTRPVGRLI